MVNKAMLIGNLTQPPEFKELQNGGIVARVKLATNKTWNDRTTGERKSVAEYHTCDVWNKLAETIQKLDLDTGTQVYVEGELNTKKYEHNGVTKYSTVIKLGGFGSEFRVLSRKEPNKEAQQTPPQTAIPSNQPTIQPVSSDGFENDLDDIPF